MTARRIIVPGAMPSRDANGRALPAKLRFYSPGTDTLASVYTSSALTTAFSQPILSNASGHFEAIWADDANSFDVAISDQTFDRQLATYTGISPASDALLASADTAQSAATSASADSAIAAAAAVTAAADAITAAADAARAEAARDEAELISGFTPSDYALSTRTITGAGLLATQGGNLTANRVFTLTEATASNIWTGNNANPMTGSSLRLAGAKQTVSYAATININFNLGNNIRTTLTGNAAMGLPTNIYEGCSGRIEIVQDGTGSRLVTSWNAFFDFGQSGTPTLSTGASAVDIIYYDVYDASGSPKARCSFSKAA